MKKKLTALILALAMCLSLMAVLTLPVSAVRYNLWEGDGTEASPWLIRDMEDLERLADVVRYGYNGKLNDKMRDCYFRLTDDIGSEEEPFTGMIGDGRDFPFEGIFDGNGHTIWLNIDQPDKDYVGLFSCGGEGTSNSGSLAVMNLTVRGSVTGHDFVGAIVGDYYGANNSSKLLLNCESYVTVTGHDFVGGIVGECCGPNNNDANSVIYNCRNYGDVTGSNYVGGILGGVKTSDWKESKALINSCLANCTVTAAAADGDCYAGGLCGYLQENCVYENCIFVGTVIGGEDQAGGWCGFDSSSDEPRRRNFCSAKDGDGNFLPPVGEYESDPHLFETAWVEDEEVPMNFYDNGEADGDFEAWLPFALSTANCKAPQTQEGSLLARMAEISYVEYSGYEGIALRWEIVEGQNDGFPVLTEVPVPTMDGSGTKDDPWLIQDADDWKNLCAMIGGDLDGDGVRDFDNRVYRGFSGRYFKLTADLGSEAAPITVMCKGSVSEADDHFGFNGYLDGCGRTVWVDLNETECGAALFEKLESNGVICNLTVAGSVKTVWTDTDDWGENCAAGLVGENDGLIDRCFNLAKVEGYFRAAGLVGENRGIIRNSGNYGEVICNYTVAGGICAIHTGSALLNCLNRGSVTCTNTTEGNTVGGLTGIHMTSGHFDNCYSAAAVTCANGSADAVGSLIGCLDGMMFEPSAWIYNSYYDSDLCNEEYIGNYNGCEYPADWKSTEHEPKGLGTAACKSAEEAGLLALLNGYHRFDSNFPSNPSDKLYPLFYDLWETGEDGYPVLKDRAELSLKGSGTAEDPYLIEDADDLQEVADAVHGVGKFTSFPHRFKDCFFRLTDDIGSAEEPFGGCIGFDWGEHAIEIADAWAGDPQKMIHDGNNIKDVPFHGTLDGCGHTVWLGAKEGSDAYGHGLFINMGGTVRNLTVAGTVYFTGGHVGALADSSTGLMENCINETVIVDDGTDTGSIAFIGGLVGTASENARLVNCCNRSPLCITSIWTSAVGGICGAMFDNSVGLTGCCNLADIQSMGSAGGLVGDLAAQNMQNCYNLGSITGGAHAGGLAGACSVYGGKTASIVNSFSSGSVSAPEDAAGALFGNGYNRLVLTNCFYNEDIPGVPEKAIGDEPSPTEGTTGLTEEEFTSPDDGGLCARLNRYLDEHPEETADWSLWQQDGQNPPGFGWQSPCITLQKAGLTDGAERMLFLNGKDSGRFIFHQVSEDGWKIERAVSVPANGGAVYLKLTGSGVLGETAVKKDASVWTYRDGAFYAVQSTEETVPGFWFLFWYIPGTTRIVNRAYALSSVKTGARLSAYAPRTELFTTVTGQHHYTELAAHYDGTHALVCDLCGYELMERCDFGGEDHRCECGALDPALVPIRPAVTITSKTVRGWFWTRYTVFTAKISFLEDTEENVRKLEYSLDHERWITGSSFNSNTEPGLFWIRVTDVEHGVHEYECRNGEVILPDQPGMGR